MSEHSWPARPEVIPDNVIAKAAVMLRELNEKQLDRIDSGRKFFSSDGKLLNTHLRAQSLAEITICDGIIERSQNMSARLANRGASLSNTIIAEIEKHAD